MTPPTSLADLLPGTIAEMAARAARAARPDFDRWTAQARSCGHCAHPIRLRGGTARITRDGKVLGGYSSFGEPDGVTYVRCGNRRARVCSSCSHEIP